MIVKFNLILIFVLFIFVTLFMILYDRLTIKSLILHHQQTAVRQETVQNFKNSINFYIKLCIMFFLVVEIILYVSTSDNEVFIGVIQLNMDITNYMIQIFCIGFLIIFFYISLIMKYKLAIEELVLLLLLGLFVIMTVYSSDMFTFFMFFEGFSLIYYILMAVGLDKANLNMKVVLQYLVFGIVSGALMLWGISVIWGITGLKNFHDIKIFLSTSTLSSENNLLKISILCILASFFFKLAIYPFHGWIIPMYNTLKESILCLFVIFTNLFTFLILISKFYLIIIKFDEILLVCQILGLLTMTIGILKSFTQNGIRGIFACSTLLNMGFLVTMLGVVWNNTIWSITSYLVIYNILTMGLFLLSSSFRSEETGDSVNILKILTNVVPDLGKYIHNEEILMIFFTLFLMGMPGPILIYKIYFINLLFSFNFVVGILALFLNILGFVMYLKIIKNISFNKVSVYKIQEKTILKKLPTKVILILVLIILLLIIFSIILTYKLGWLS